MKEVYRKQVMLLLNVLPEVAKEQCFALHGGTAINLFVREMPRLSVDIDLTYIEIAERNVSLENANGALQRIKERVERWQSNVHVRHNAKTCKLQVEQNGALIKIEVNMIGRGLLRKVQKALLCQAAQQEFDLFCTMPLVPMSQLYGGKLCAALDRQHPRDLFDVKLLFDNEGFSEEIRKGLIYGLVSSNRPTHELLNPHFLDQRSTFNNQFEGMSTIPFSYDDFEATRHQLVETVISGLRKTDTNFLLSLNRLEPDWSIYDFKEFPSVKWKLANLEKFRESSPQAYWDQVGKLEEVLGC